MCNFLTYTTAINQNFGVLLIHKFKYATSFKLSLPGHFSRFEYFTEVLMKVQFCGVRCHVDRFTLVVGGNFYRMTLLYIPEDLNLQGIAGCMMGHRLDHSPLALHNP